MTRRQYNREPTPLGIAFFLLAILNFVAFLVGVSVLGGDAVSGKIENGHYYVADHGRFTEVTPTQWHYSKWHTRSIWITHPLDILAAIVFTRPRRLKATTKGPDAPWELMRH